VGLSCRGREGYAPSNGLDALRSHAGEIGDTVVAMMGYNDAGATFATAVDQFVALATELGAERVVWLTFKTDVSYVGPTFAANDQTYRSNNRILEEKRQAYGDRLLLADWNTIGRANPSWFEADGVHLTRAGAAALGTFLNPHDDDGLGTGLTVFLLVVMAVGAWALADGAITGWRGLVPWLVVTLASPLLLGWTAWGEVDVFAMALVGAPALAGAGVGAAVHEAAAWSGRQVSTTSAPMAPPRSSGV
jgi:hypothetical protein